MLHFNELVLHLFLFKVTTSSCALSTDSDQQDGASFNKVAARKRNKDAFKKQWETWNKNLIYIK